MDGIGIRRTGFLGQAQNHLIFAPTTGLRASWLKRAKAMSAALWITKPKGGGKGRKIAETCVFKQINTWNMGMIFSHISMEIIYYL